MAIHIISDVIPKEKKKRKRQPEENVIDLLEKPVKKRKSCKADVEKPITTEELHGIRKKNRNSGDKFNIEICTTENTVDSIVSQENGVTSNGVKSKRNKKRKTSKEKSRVNKAVDTNGAIHSSKPEQNMEVVEDGDINNKESVNVVERSKSRKRRKAKNVPLQENSTENNDGKTAKILKNEVPSAENNESVDCDIMLNVTSEPVKTKNGGNDFFNDVHSKIQKMNRRKWTKTIAPPQHLIIGDLESQVDHHQPHEEGLKLSFKKAGISKNVLHYHRASSLAYAKRSYKNFIKGDLIIHFKNTNLHKIDGYGK